MAIYFQCPEFDGTSSVPLPTREEAIRATQTLLDTVQVGRFALTAAERENRTRAIGIIGRRPVPCQFRRVNDPPTALPVHTEFYWGHNLRRDRPDITAQWLCTRHNVHPIVWGRRDAWATRVNPLMNAKYRPIAERITFNTRNGFTERTITYYLPNRPAPITLHSHWPRPNAART